MDESCPLQGRRISSATWTLSGAGKMFGKEVFSKSEKFLTILGILETVGERAWKLTIPIQTLREH